MPEPLENAENQEVSADEPKRRKTRKKNPAVEQIENQEGEAEPKRRKKRATKLDMGALARQVQGFHLFLAMSTKTPELVISEAEANTLAKAAADFADEYGLEVSNRIVVLVQLFGACAMVYGPRIVAIKNRISKQREISEVMQDGSGETTENPIG